MPFPWYYHFGANLIQHRKRNYRIAKSAFAAYSIKRTMPYLRGSIKKYKPVGATSVTTYRNSAAIRTLQRKVNQLKPETQRFLNAYLYNAPNSPQYNQQRYDITTELASTADRDLRITGDSWRNKKLTVRVSLYDSTDWNEELRMLVVVPKKAGTTFTFNHNIIPDKDQMRVLYDKTVTMNSGNGVRNMVAHILLRDMKTTYLGNTPEKNSIQLYLLSYNNASGPTIHNVTWELLYSDM